MKNSSHALSKILSHAATLFLLILCLSIFATPASAVELSPNDAAPQAIANPGSIYYYNPANNQPSERTNLPQSVLLRFGQQVVAKDGATYYESADLAGSGRQGTANNIYTETLRIAGFANVGPDSEHLTDYLCYLRDDVPSGKPAPNFVSNSTEESLWIAVYTDGFTTGSVGWFHVTDLSYALGEMDYPPEKSEESPNGFSHPDSPGTSSFEQILDNNRPDPDEDLTTGTVASAIENSSKSGEKIALFLDASGSVESYSAAIASYAGQVDNAEYIAIFASTARDITAASYNDYRYEVGGMTDIYGALNTLPNDPFDTVIIVTDTEHNYDSEKLSERNDIGSVVILNIYAPEYAEHPVLDAIETAWHVRPSVRQLSME